MLFLVVCVAVLGICVLNLEYPAVYPSNQQFVKHFAEFARFGYKPHLGAIECKFPYKDGSRQILPHSVGICDGFCKLLCMLGVIAFVKELELTEEELKDPTLSGTLKSFRSISCSYSHFTNPGHHFLYSLSNLPCGTYCIFLSFILSQTCHF